jgi:hypothetical protein
LKFFNETRLPAELLRTVLDEERLSASVLSRATFDIHGTQLVLAAEQPYIVSPAPWESPHGEFEADQAFKRGGVDVFVWGRAFAPHGRSATSSTVTIAVGEIFRRDVRVFGPRAWTRALGGLRPSAPREFTSIPLSLEYAYGGKSSWDGLEVPWPDNPEGMGFYIEEREAEGGVLPLFEDPHHPIERWDDRPSPVGFGVCPITSGSRMKSAVVLAEDGRVKEITPRMFNAAFPEMVIPAEVPPGAVVHLLGVTPGGHLYFNLPPRLPVAKIVLGDKVVDRALAIDQIGVDVEAQKVLVSYRFPFRYRFEPEQQRAVTLLSEPS